MYAYLTFANTIHVRKLTHLSLRVFVCLIIFEIVGKQHFSIFYIFLEVILASCDIWRLQDSRTINSLEEVCVTLNRDKIWSKWIQLRNFFVLTLVGRTCLFSWYTFVLVSYHGSISFIWDISGSIYFQDCYLDLHQLPLSWTWCFNSFSNCWFIAFLSVQLQSEKASLDRPHSTLAAIFMQQ